MIRIGSDTNIGMNRNSSDWLGMISYPILSPGMSMHLVMRSKQMFVESIKLFPECSNLENQGNFWSREIIKIVTFICCRIRR